MEFTSFFDWSTLSSLAGCAVAVSAATQMLKGVGFINKIPTQIVSYVLACIILLASYAFTGGLTASLAAIIPLNAILVSLTSNSVYGVMERLSGGEKNE